MYNLTFWLCSVFLNYVENQISVTHIFSSTSVKRENGKKALRIPMGFIVLGKVA